MHAACTPTGTPQARCTLPCTPHTACTRAAEQSLPLAPRREAIHPMAPSTPAVLATGQATPGAAHGRDCSGHAAPGAPHPPSPPAGTMASSSTTTTRSSSASAAPGACLRSSSGTARWACLWRCEPLALHSYPLWLAGLRELAHAQALPAHLRLRLCVRQHCGWTPSDLTSPVLTCVALLLAAAKVGHFRVAQHFHQEQPRRPQVSLRRAIVTSCSVHVSMLLRACAARAVLRKCSAKCSQCVFLCVITVGMHTMSRPRSRATGYL